MKLSPTLLTTWVITIVVCGCGPRPYTNKELKTQKVPDVLKSKTWTLKQISIANSDTIFHVYQQYDSNLCPFTLRFEDKGTLATNFKAHKLSGTYLIDGDKFKYFNFGWTS